MALRDEILADNPIHFWDFEETSGTTAANYGSANRPLTHVGTPQVGVTGAVLPHAVDYKVDDYSEADNHASLNISDKVVIESVFEYPSEVGGVIVTKGRVSGGGSQSNQTPYALYANEGQIRFEIGRSGRFARRWRHILIGPAVQVGQKVHVIAEWNGKLGHDSVRMFVNGALVAVETQYAASEQLQLIASSNPLRITNDPSRPAVHTSHAAARVDFVAIYSELSDTRKSAHFSESNLSSPLTPPTPIVLDTREGRIKLRAYEAFGGSPPYSFQWHKGTTGFTPSESSRIAGATTDTFVDADTEEGSTYAYALEVVDSSETVAYSTVITITAQNKYQISSHGANGYLRGFPGLRIEGVSFLPWSDDSGGQYVTEYNEATGEEHEHLIGVVPPNRHVTPVLERMGDGTIVVAFADYGYANWVRRSLTPNTLTGGMTPAQVVPGNGRYQQLIRHGNELFLFYAKSGGGDRRDAGYVVSSDNGVTWSEEVTYFENPDGVQDRVYPVLHQSPLTGRILAGLIDKHPTSDAQVMDGDGYVMVYDGQWKDVAGNILTLPVIAGSETARFYKASEHGGAALSFQVEVRDYADDVFVAVAERTAEADPIQGVWNGQAWGLSTAIRNNDDIISSDGLIDYRIVESQVARYEKVAYDSPYDLVAIETDYPIDTTDLDRARLAGAKGVSTPESYTFSPHFVEGAGTYHGIVYRRPDNAHLIPAVAPAPIGVAELRPIAVARDEGDGYAVSIPGGSLTIGSYRLRARAVYADGTSVDSDPVEVTINA